jgi:hypothetical protein
MKYEMLDGKGNKLVLESGKPYRIKLELKGKRPKLIAQWDNETKTLFIKRNSARHYHYKTRSYGFNADLLTSLEINNVNMTIDREQFIVPIDEFKNARHLNFSQEGFELQKFLPVEIIRKYAVQSL